MSPVFARLPLLAMVAGALLVCLASCSRAETPPRFTHPPESQVGVSGGVASFVCRATGDPKPNITWAKKGKKLSSQRFEIIDYDNGASSVLRIQPLRPARDEAEYECVASNVLGQISKSVKLRVLREDQVPPGFPRIDMMPQLKVVERTRTATMLCAATGNPDPDIRWFKDFFPVDTQASAGRIKQLRTGSGPIRGALQIDLSEDSDQGKYECVASNDVGTVYSAPANLYVRVRHVPPRFSIPPKSQEIMPGGSVNVSCVAVGSPMPYVKWMSGGEDLTPEEEMPIGRNVLELSNVRESANYTCVAMSSLGVVEATAQVTVKALPRPPSMPVVTETTATSVTLTWDSGNAEPITYYVLRYRPITGGGGGGGAPDGRGHYQEIDGVATTRYTVGGLGPYSEYEFLVAAVNNIGRGSQSDAVLTRTSEQAPSSPPRNVQARMLSATTMLVTWEEPEEPNGQIRGYRVYYTTERGQPVSAWLKHNLEDSLLTTIGSLTPQADYTVRVLAFTSVGDGPHSPELHVKTQQGVPSQPINLKAEAESATSVLLSWIPPRQDSIIKYELLYRDGPLSKEQVVTFEPSMTYLLEGLRPNTLYQFRLAARSEHGLGAATSIVTAQTLPSTPSAAPQDVSCSSPGSTSLLISWQPPPAHAHNGPIVGYAVRYRALPDGQGQDGATREEAVEMGAAAGEAAARGELLWTLQGLQKWTEYRVTVVAYTAVGAGPESRACTVRTDEDVPSGPPRRVESEPLNATALRVSWRPPAPGRQHGAVRGFHVHLVRIVNGEPRGATQLRDVMLPDAQADASDSTEHEMIIGALTPETTYSVTVAAYTAKGDGARSKPRLVVTLGAVPGRPRLSVSYTQANTALVQWQAPTETHGALLGYRLAFGRADGDRPTSLDFSTREDHYTVTELHRGAVYSFRLSARNRAGLGEEATREVVTPEAAPSGFPRGLRVVAATATGVQVAWEAPALPERNGRVSRYTLSCRDIDGAAEQLAEVEPAAGADATTEQALAGLRAGATYDIRVRAHTAQGPGPYSPSIQARIAPSGTGDRAAFVKNFGVKSVSRSSALLTWELPDSYSPQQPFKIVVNNGQQIEVDGWATRKRIAGLLPNTEYYFGLASRGDGAGGLQQEVGVRTAPDLPQGKPLALGRVRPDGTLPTELPDPPEEVSLRAYYVVVVPLKRHKGRFVKPAEIPDDLDLDEIVDGGNQQRRRRRRRHGPVARAARDVEGPRPYVAARFPGGRLPADFTLGDGLEYGGHVNRRLSAGQDYVFFVLYELEPHDAGSRMFVASPYSDPVVSPDPEPLPITEEEEGLLWVVGPVLAVVFIICVVIAILLYKRKRSDSDPGKPMLPGGAKETSPLHTSDPVEMRRINFQTPGFPAGSLPGELAAPQSMINHPPIPIAELSDHVERLKSNNNLKFSQEYESIDPGQQFTWEHSNLEVNKPKNRYANVIAYDHSRVILQTQDGVPGSDYINANYMDGYRKQNAYIATQGPLPETFADFWRMVWEQRSSTIVMMTRLEERCRVKCDQYWPARGSETYGLVQVSLVDTLELASYAVRTFTLHKNGSNEKREVRQFQFTAWPDHGVPEYPTPFLAFLRRVKTCNPSDAGPMVVHCSAGVGRTGCFVVLDATLERLRSERTADVYGFVTCLRSQRNYTVQTEEQYVFVHEALLEAATAGPTEVPARTLYAHLQQLGTAEPGENTTRMQLEFRRLALGKSSPSRFISANLPCNKFKNRLVNVMPYEATRVPLQPIRGVEGSDYINASFVDGYRQQAAYIATQGPMAETTEDFWRMLWEHNSTIVVMLTKLREMGREKCHQYWPAERSARYQYFVVDPMAEYNMPQYILREFKVTDARDGQSRTVRQFQFTDWPEQGVPKSGEGFIDFIGQVHKTKEQFGQDGPITVHCSAGVGRTGVFITLSIVLERMRYEGVVDVFQTVKMLRTQRPAAVQTEDQYQLCYRAALEYLGSFDHYAT
ncbi:receptor-type tyrosine-protein phosphatase delta isoform X3 [Lampetra fluviatilis]